MANRKTWRRPIRTTPETVNLIISLFNSGMMSSEIYWASKLDKTLFGYRVHKSTISKFLRANGIDPMENTIWGTKLSRKENKTENEIAFDNLNSEDSENLKDEEEAEFDESESEIPEIEPEQNLSESEDEFEEFQEPEESDEFKP